MDRPIDFYELMRLRNTLRKQLMAAEEKLADAKNSGNEQAEGYAYGEVCRIKNEIRAIE